MAEKMNFLLDVASKTRRASCVQIVKSSHSLTALVFSNPKMMCMTVLHSVCWEVTRDSEEGALSRDPGT